MPVDLARAFGRLFLARIRSGLEVFEAELETVAQALRTSNQETDINLADLISIKK